MTALLELFWKIATLRAQPQDLPGNPLVLWVSLLLAALTLGIGLLISHPPGESLLRVFIALASPGVLLFIALSVAGLRERFVQAYSAICGASSVVYLFALPLLPAFAEIRHGVSPGAFTVVLLLALDLWTLLISAHVLRHSFNTGFATGIGLALALTFATLILMFSIGPGAKPPPERDTLSGEVSALFGKYSRSPLAASGSACLNRFGGYFVS